MAEITLKGNSIKTAGSLPEVGSKAPDFTLTKTDLSETRLSDYNGKYLVLNIFPSVDTGTCAASVRQFNKEATKLNNTVILDVSRDLPFAHKRFCDAEGIDNVMAASEFRDTAFSDNYHVKITEGPLTGLFSRCIVIIDPDGKVVYTEQVPEIVDEPDYEMALEALK
jgi:thiol peroxidase